MSYTIPITIANLTSKHIQTIPFVSSALFETIGSSNLMRQILAQAKLPQYWLRAQQVYVIFQEPGKKAFPMNFLDFCNLKTGDVRAVKMVLKEVEREEWEEEARKAGCLTKKCAGCGESVCG